MRRYAMSLNDVSCENISKCDVIGNILSRPIFGSYLLVGNDVDTLQHSAERIACSVLNFNNLENCVDLFTVMPSGAMRQISVDDIRNLCRSIALSPKMSDKKCAIICDVDRMNTAAANAFLKTLEEPPLDTVIILTTTKSNNVLPTIVSRCLMVRIPFFLTHSYDAVVKDWISEYTAWLDENIHRGCDDNNHRVIRMYRLLTSLESIFFKSVDEYVRNGNSESEAKRIVSEWLFGVMINGIRDFFEKDIENIGCFYKIAERLDAKYRLFSLNIGFIICAESFLIEVFCMFNEQRKGD